MLCCCFSSLFLVGRRRYLSCRMLSLKVMVWNSSYIKKKLIHTFFTKFTTDTHSDENSSEFWKASAQNQLRTQLRREINSNTAKNVIFFMGDGMSISSITAARIYQGQLNGRRGEEGQLSFEQFPYVGISKVIRIACRSRIQHTTTHQLFIFVCRPTASTAKLRTRLVQQQRTHLVYI